MRSKERYSSSQRKQLRFFVCLRIPAATVPVRSSADFLAALQRARPGVRASLDVAFDTLSVAPSAKNPESPPGGVQQKKGTEDGDRKDTRKTEESTGHGGVLLDFMLGRDDPRLLRLLKEALTAMDSGGRR